MDALKHQTMAYAVSYNCTQSDFAKFKRGFNNQQTVHSALFKLLPKKPLQFLLSQLCKDRKSTR